MVSWKRIKSGAFAELYSHKKLRIVSIIILAFAGLLYGFGANNNGVLGLGMFLYVTALFCLFIACINVFKDMHDIPSADVQMSMPLNSSERYLSRLFTIFLIWGLPFIISAAIAFLMYLALRGWNNITGLKLSEHLTILLSYISTVLHIVAVTVICQCCVGSKAESRYMPVLVMGIIRSVPTCIAMFIQNKFADIGSFFDNIYRNLTLLFASEDGWPLALVLWYMVFIAIILAGLLIYKKRDARSVGKPIVFPVFFEIVMCASLMMFFTIAHIDEGVIASVMLIAWLGSIILRIIVSRKRFKLSRIIVWTVQYAAYYAVFIVFMFAAFKTGGFGALYKTPEKLELNNYTNVDIEVAIPSYINDGDYHYDDYSPYYQYDKLMESNEANNAALINQLIECTSEYAKEQANAKGLFMHKMFDTKDCNAYRCSITVSSLEGTDYYGYGYERLYNIEFYISPEKAKDFVNQLSSYDFVEYIEDTDS